MEQAHSSNEQTDSSEVINWKWLGQQSCHCLVSHMHYLRAWNSLDAVEQSHPKEAVLKFMAKDYVSVEDIVNLGFKVLWNRYKHLFTTVACDLLTAVQEGLQSWLNTCPACKTEYADGAIGS